jgi:hypothetical protein
MTNGDDINDYFLIVYRVNDPVIANTYSPQVFGTFELSTCGGPWIVLERFNFS